MPYLTNVTPDTIRAHFETDLSDDALQRVIDAQVAEVTRYAGDYGERTERFDPYHAIILSQPALSITQIRSIDGDIIIDPAYYEFDYGSVITPNGEFVGLIEVTYTPRESDFAIREMAIIDLCKIELQYNGVQQQQIGDYQVSMGADWRNQKRAILRELRRGPMLV